MTAVTAGRGPRRARLSARLVAGARVEPSGRDTSNGVGERHDELACHRAGPVPGGSEKSAAERVHFVHFTTLRPELWTLCPYSVHFVHVTSENRVAWTLCPLPSTPQCRR